MIDITGVYRKGMTAEELAQKVLFNYYGDEEPSFPIDPFKMIRDMGIIYQFMEFKDLEGIYIFPDDGEDIPLIGVNFNRPIARQRYTAAHEICHHIKDRDNGICPIRGKKNSIERYADNFASELLMPKKYLKREAEKYAANGKVGREGALRIAEFFGTSFESTVFSLAYKLDMIEGETDADSIKKENRKYKPEKKKIILGLDTESVNLWEQVVNSYEFFWKGDRKHAWYIFKNDFIYNENRLEKLNLDDDVVAEIIADLRFNRSESQYCNEECEEIIQIAGHSELYDYIYDTDDSLDIYKIQKLNKLLYTYAPFPEAGGVYRQDDNFVIGAKFETVNHYNVFQEIILLAESMEKLVEDIEFMSAAEVIKKAAQIHHRLTVIHPFRDGNGRSSRALLNWTFRLKGLPPIYIKYPEKDEYYEGLKLADTGCGYDKLYKLLMKECIRSSIQLNRVDVAEQRTL
ncbi:MAG: Fic family protein [Bacillota bacterium]|nr:Fic family protein [Bacillota bacterium]